MSGGVLAAAAAAALSAAADPPVARNDVSLAVPSLDGARGLAVAYERWLPERRLSLGGSIQLRETATGDFTGLRTGAGAELRWYWRASAWRSAQPRGSMVGWFVGARVDVALDATHDRVESRWLGTALDLGATGEVGYRIAPWRGLEVTPTAGLVLHREVDLSGRLPGWTRGGIGAGLAVGWLF